MSDPGQIFSDGKVYERMMGRWSKLVGRIFLDWLAPPKGLHWIEVGCGNGAFTEELIAHCAPRAVDAIDPSEGQLTFARTRPSAKLARFRQADAQALPFADKSFDAAAMALVITFVPDPAKAVAEMARVVRPGGLIATYMWDIAGGGLPLTSIATNCCITATDEQGHGHIVRPLLAILQPSRAFRATDDLANYFFRFQLCKFCLNQLQP